MFEKSGVKLQSLSEPNPRETRFGSRYREVRETEGSRNRDFTVYFRAKLFALNTNSTLFLLIFARETKRSVSPHIGR